MWSSNCFEQENKVHYVKNLSNDNVLDEPS